MHSNKMFWTILVTLTLTACGIEEDDGGNQPQPCGDDCVVPNPTPPVPVCGDGKCNGTETAETCEADCKKVEPAPVPETLACPFKTDGAWNWNVAGKYVSGATKGEIRFFTKFADGSYPNPQVLDSNESGYMGMEYKLAPGTYRFSYIGYQYSTTCQGSNCPMAWAQYGDLETLQKLSTQCLAFIDCNWWDAVGQKMVDVSCAECALKVNVAANGTITSGGNMASLK